MCKIILGAFGLMITIALMVLGLNLTLCEPLYWIFVGVVTFVLIEVFFYLHFTKGSQKLPSKDLSIFWNSAILKLIFGVFSFVLGLAGLGLFVLFEGLWDWLAAYWIIIVQCLAVFISCVAIVWIIILVFYVYVSCNATFAEGQLDKQSKKKPSRPKKNK